MMFLLKLAAGTLARPLLLALILAGVGLSLLRGGRRRSGIWTLFAGAALAYLASTSLIGNALLSPLEHRYPTFEPTQEIALRDIVVLGSGYEPSDGVPVTGALDAAGLARIVEGVRLALARPGSRLLVSGGAATGLTPIAWGYARMATELGIERSKLFIMDRALNTTQEAHEVYALLGGAPFILVTSANHMPRAMQLMHRAGANPVAAPTAQIVHAHQRYGLPGLVPGSGGLHKTETALHEYLGYAAAKLGID
jgi:uncharacterized SAM-binding protein YcdF (DUF218 family)